MFISPVTQMVAHEGLAVRMEADVPRELPEALIPVAVLQGVRPADGSAAPIVDVLSVEEVVVAIRELMEAGDPKAFGTTGEPKLAALSKQLGTKVSDALRDAAWDVVQAGA